jgi:hypothetical protein
MLIDFKQLDYPGDEFGLDTEQKYLIRSTIDLSSVTHFTDIKAVDVIESAISWAKTATQYELTPPIPAITVDNVPIPYEIARSSCSASMLTDSQDGNIWDVLLVFRNPNLDGATGDGEPFTIKDVQISFSSTGETISKTMAPVEEAYGEGANLGNAIGCVIDQNGKVVRIGGMTVPDDVTRITLRCKRKWSDTYKALYLLALSRLRDKVNNSIFLIFPVGCVKYESFSISAQRYNGYFECEYTFLLRNPERRYVTINDVGLRKYIIKGKTAAEDVVVERNLVLTSETDVYIEKPKGWTYIEFTARANKFEKTAIFTGGTGKKEKEPTVSETIDAVSDIYTEGTPKITGYRFLKIHAEDDFSILDLDLGRMQIPGAAILPTDYPELPPIGGTIGPSNP